MHGAARLAVHLNRDCDGVGDQHGRIVCRPAAVEHGLRATQVRPALLGDVGRKWGEQLNQRQNFVAVHRALAGAQDVDVLHHRRNGGVVRECGNVFADLADGRVQLAQHGHVGRTAGDAFVHRTPDALQESAHTGDATVAVVSTFFVGTEEHEIGAEAVSTPALDQFIGVDDIALRLGHLGAFADDHSVRAEARERFLEVEVAAVVQRHRDEARIQQMQHGVLVAADVGRDRQPALRERAIERDIAAIGARIAQEIPGAVEKVVGDVSLAATHDAALRTGHAIPLIVARERRNAAVIGTEIFDQRQQHRQLFLRHRHRTAGIAIDDGDRRSPVPLPGDAPVVQAIIHRRRGAAPFLEPRHDGLFRLWHRHAREVRGIDQQIAV